LRHRLKDGEELDISFLKTDHFQGAFSRKNKSQDSHNNRENGTWERANLFIALQIRHVCIDTENVLLPQKALKCHPLCKLLLL